MAAVALFPMTAEGPGAILVDEPELDRQAETMNEKREYTDKQSSHVFDVFVEIPGGSRNKYEYDKDAGVFRLDRMLYSSVVYPGDYGYIPDTLARDGDALDALVLLGEPTFSGCMIDARIIGMLDMEDEKGPDEKLICVPDRDPRWVSIQVLDDLPSHLLDEVEHFFSIYKDLERKHVTIHGWRARETAMQTLRDCLERYRGGT